MSASPRLAGLDLLRGLAVAGMIVVNSPGSWDYVWWPLDHAPWNGCTFADLVFPAFLFAMGVALGLSFPRTFDAADRRAMWLRVARRTLALIALGWAITFVAHLRIDTLRLLGVLPRIGLTYGLAASIAMLTVRRSEDGRAHLNIGVLAATAFTALIGYWALMTLVPVPGYGAGDLSKAGNLAAWIDRAVLTPAHMWRGGKGVFDPEGLLSTIPALANVLFGMIAAAAWKRAPEQATKRIAIAGAAAIAVGLVWGIVFPLNKSLWTSSFALLTSGVAALTLALCIVVERRPARILAPLRVLGMNALMGYLISSVLGIAADQVVVGQTADGPVTLQAWGFGVMSHVIAQPYLASFLCALVILAIVLAAVTPLHRRGIHLRL
jgi:predicted acyltransferase